MAKKKPDIPVFNTPIYETHCHLDYLEAEDLDAVLTAAREVGVNRFLTIAVSPENLSKTYELSQKYEDVYCTQGVHPHDAEHFDATANAQIKSALDQDASSLNSKICAVGEIGLDYYYDHSDRVVQRKVFETQLKIAIDHQLPVVIHAREADEDTVAMLKAMGPDLVERKGVIHSFTAGMALAETALELGFSLGFNGIVTFNKADNVREALSITPLDKILLETDAPYLTPVPYRGVTNEPKYLPFIAQKVADVKAVTVEDLIAKTTENAKTVFWPGTL